MDGQKLCLLFPWHSPRARTASRLSRTSVSLVSQRTACLKRSPIMRRKEFHALRRRETRNERKAWRREPRETSALKWRARGITGENLQRPRTSDKTVEIERACGKRTQRGKQRPSNDAF
ncbi:hypothetical protein TNCV_1991211 [Trichonephila clavipes]|nr:hypothetical protein TNCV_1991211 [Trichonephila clavipes]